MYGRRVSLEQRMKDAFGGRVNIYDLWRTLLAKEDVHSIEDLKKRKHYIVWTRFEIQQMILFQIPFNEDVFAWEAQIITNAIINKTRQYYYGKKKNSYPTSRGKAYKFLADYLAYDEEFCAKIFENGTDYHNKDRLIDNESESA